MSGIVCLENKGRRADERSADGCDHVVRLPTSGRKPTLASFAAGAFSPYQLCTLSSSSDSSERGIGGRTYVCVWEGRISVGVISRAAATLFVFYDERVFAGDVVDERI